MGGGGPHPGGSGAGALAGCALPRRPLMDDNGARGWRGTWLPECLVVGAASREPRRWRRRRPMTAGTTGDLVLGLLAGLALGALHLLWLRRASARLGAGTGTGAVSYTHLRAHETDSYL